jgi:large subunit ribosomal protein L2
MADTGESFKVTAPEGIYIGQKVSINHADGVRVGDILALREIPPGTLICHVENRPLDGGSFARSSGTYAQVIGPSPGGVEVKLPSGKSKVLNPECRAMIGVVSGGGRMEKPFLKAGKKYHWLRAKAGKRMPIVRGVAMNPVDHPFGGGAHQHPGKPKTVSKHAPPGRKVGSFGARSRKDKKRKQG